MLDEKTQFALSQYLDGTLPETERAAVELLLRSDAEAAATLGQYRRLNTLLSAGTGPLPAVDWADFSHRISQAIDRQAVAPLAAVAEAARTRAWFAAPRAWIMAASLLLACGAAWLAMKPSSPTVATAPLPPAAVAEVRVLLPSQTANPTAIAEITIGPAAAVQTAAVWELHPELLQDQPSGISIAGGPQLAPRDELFQIYQ